MLAATSNLSYYLMRVLGMQVGKESRDRREVKRVGESR